MIYPEKYPHTAPAASREHEFYQYLSKFGDDYDIYYSLKLRSPEGPAKEIDFLVITDNYVCLIELKNGLYRINSGTLEVRFSENGNKSFKPSKTIPINQIQEAHIRLLDFLSTPVNGLHHLRKESVTPLLLFLQEGNRSVFNTVDYDHLTVFFSGGRNSDNLKSIIEGQIKKFMPPVFGASSRQTAKELILNSTSYVTGFTQRMKQENQLLALTTEQYATLLKQESSPRTLISGVAGSGKTLVLLEAVRRNARQGRKILFLCHNSALGSHLERETAELPNVYTSRITGLELEIIRTVDPEFGKRKEDNKLKTDLDSEITGGQTSVYLKKILPEKALEHAENWLNEFHKGQFDLIVIDEAQDILTETEMLFIDSLLKGGLSQGNWIFAYDADQALTGEIKSGLDYLDGLQPERHHLTTNIRTPHSVYAMAKKVTGLGGESIVKDTLQNLQIVYYNDERNAETGMLRILNFATEELEFKPHEILILGPKAKKHTISPGSKQILGKKDEWKIRLVKEGDFIEGYIGYAEISRFKGLEAPFVILTGFDDWKSDDGKNLLYVAMTRATQGLAMLLPETMREFIESAMGQN